MLKTNSRNSSIFPYKKRRRQIIHGEGLFWIGRRENPFMEEGPPPISSHIGQSSGGLSTAKVKEFSPPAFSLHTPHFLAVFLGLGRGVTDN